MAEVDTGGGKGGKKGSKKVSTKIDMTPMVDLAFLLITFFMLTTTFSKPQTMEVVLPDKSDVEEKQKVPETKTMTIVLSKNDKIYYYEGAKDPRLDSSNYSDQGIRRVLLRKKQAVGEPIVIIKAMDDAKYKNMVDILDEMAITGIKIYSIVDISQQDKDILKKHNLL